MRFAKLAWALWALVPVAGLSFHYGPGQKLYRQDLAARQQNKALALEKEASELQAKAYAKHLEAIEARKRAFLEATPEAEAAANAATDAETAAFMGASAAWRLAADAFGRMQQIAEEATPQVVQKIRWSRARALVRSGDIWTGIGELEDVLAEIEGAPEGSKSEMSRKTREELGAAYYYAARLMRLSGAAEEDWRVESGKARQHFRYLAEQARRGEQPRAVAENHERNVELVLDLEQSSILELQGKPLPKDSPLRGTGNRPGNRQAKTKRPPNQRDGRGAGGAEGIFTGW